MQGGGAKQACCSARVLSFDRFNYTLSIKNIAAAIGLSHTEIEALN